MPIKVSVTFTKEIDITVVGETLEEVKAAAEALASSGDIDRDWDTDGWDVTAYPVGNNGKDKFWTPEKLEKLKCHMGVVEGGELQHINDYNQEKGTNVPEAED